MLKLLAVLCLSLASAWLVLVVALIVWKPSGGRLREALGLIPDVIGLLRALAADRTLDRGIRARLWLLLAYLAMPIDLIPDFLPVIGYADDVIIVLAVLRSCVRRAGADAVRQRWPGSPAGLDTVWRIAGLGDGPG